MSDFFTGPKISCVPLWMWLMCRFSFWKPAGIRRIFAASSSFLLNCVPLLSPPPCCFLFWWCIRQRAWSPASYWTKINWGQVVQTPEWMSSQERLSGSNIARSVHICPKFITCSAQHMGTNTRTSGNYNEVIFSNPFTMFLEENLSLLNEHIFIYLLFHSLFIMSTDGLFPILRV